MRGLVLGLAAAGAGLTALVLAHGSASAAEDEPTDVADRVSKALASHDAGTMRGEAAALKREGYAAAAQALLDEANRIDPGQSVKPKPPAHPQAALSAAGQQAAAVMTGHTAGGPTSTSAGWQSNPPLANTSSALPPGAFTSSTGVEDPGRHMAQQVTTMLQGIGGLKGRGSEDKGLVNRFQQNEKLTPDGKYGPGTATRILQRYGVMPVAPFYWSKKNASTQKKAFLAFVRGYATGDPDRKSQYDQLIADTNRS